MAIQRLGSFIGEHGEAGLDVVAGAHRACEEIDRVGEQRFDLTHAAVPNHPNV